MVSLQGANFVSCKLFNLNIYIFFPNLVISTLNKEKKFRLYKLNNLHVVAVYCNPHFIFRLFYPFCYVY